MNEPVRFTAPLRLTLIEEGYDPSGSVLMPADVADQVRSRVLASGKRAAFGAVRVEARLGGSLWKTSLAPVKGGGWFLPIKKSVRLAEGLREGDPVEVELQLL